MFSEDGVGPPGWYHEVIRYVPHAVVERMCDERLAPLTEAEGQQLNATVAFVDISGFTKLSEKLAREYKEHASEKLNEYISGYFSRLVTAVHKHGGDILKFAGDAMLVLFKDGAQHAVRSVQCCLQLMEDLNGFSPVKGVELQLHVGIGCGCLSAFFVGGHRGSWEYFVAGDPIQQMSDAADIATSGQVVISRAVHDAVALFGPAGEWRNEQLFLVTALSSAVDVTPLPPPPVHVPAALVDAFVPAFVRQRRSQRESSHRNLLLSQIQHAPGVDDLNFKQRQQLMMAIRQSPLSLDTSRFLSAEYRRCVILFVLLPGISYSQDVPLVLPRLQTAVAIVQKNTHKMGGYVARLLADDKGTRFKLVFGMPTMHHEDDIPRAVRCALAIEQQLAQCADMDTSIGMACGVVFCGAAGSAERCEYTAVGYKVILAARLMSKAEKRGGGILVEEAIYAGGAYPSIDYTALQPIPLKGIEQPVPIWQPHLVDPHTPSPLKTGRLRRVVSPPVVASPLASTALSQESQDVLLGRDAEQKQLRDAIESLSESTRWRHTRAFALMGEGGIGKSSLAHYAIDTAECNQVPVLYSACTTFVSVHDAADSRGRADSDSVSANSGSSVLSLFKPVIMQMLLPEEGEPLLDTDMLAGSSSLRSNLHLVDEWLGTELASASSIPQAQPSMAARTRAIRGVCLKLFQRALTTRRERRGVLLVLENVHGADTASLELLRELLCANLELLVVFTSRVPKHKWSLVPLLALSNCAKLELQPLSQAHTERLACQCLGVRSLPADVRTVVWQKSQGHPLHVQELVSCLLERRLVQVESDGTCSVQASYERLLQTCPSSMSDVILSRVDRLSCDASLSFKVASVLGVSFIDLDMLSAVHPQKRPVHMLKKDMAELCAAGFVLSNKSTLTQPAKGKGKLQRSRRKSSLDMRAAQSVYLTLRPPSSSPPPSTPRKGRPSISFPVSRRNSLIPTSHQPLYSFVHALFSEVVRECLLLSQRQLIHQSAASFFLSKYTTCPSPELLSLLAYHFHHAGQDDLDTVHKALKFSELAAAESLRQQSNSDARVFYQRALHLLDKERQLQSVPATSIEQQVFTARRQLSYTGLGHAFERMGRMQEAIHNFLTALQLLEQPVPSLLSISVWRMAVQQDIKRNHGVEQQSEYEPTRSSRKTATADVLQCLSRLYFTKGEPLLSAWCCFRLIELSERLFTGELLSTAYSLAALCCLAIERHALGEAFVRKALQVLQWEKIPQSARGRCYLYLAHHAAAAAQWELALSRTEKAGKQLEQCGEWRSFRETVLCRGAVQLVSGLRSVKSVSAKLASLEKGSARDGDEGMESWARLWGGFCDLLLAERDDELEELRERLEVAYSHAVSERSAVHALLLLCSALRTADTEAWTCEVVEACNEWGGRTCLLWSMSLRLVVQCLVACIALCTPTPTLSKEYQSALHQALQRCTRSLQEASARSPGTLPMYSLARAMQTHVAGGDASTQWQSAQRQARSQHSYLLVLLSAACVGQQAGDDVMTALDLSPASVLLSRLPALLRPDTNLTPSPAPYTTSTTTLHDTPGGLSQPLLSPVADRTPTPGVSYGGTRSWRGSWCPCCIL